MSSPVIVVSICMTTTTTPETTTIAAETPSDTSQHWDDDARLRRRLLPLYLAAAFGGLSLWVPVEKLFLSTIGFDAASIGIMAAAYAAVVPILEIPSGILADRWSRRGVLIIANVALAASAVVGGLSTNVATYMVAALLLGVFFALQSGTADSIIYDTLMEETGRSEGFERSLGRLHLWQGVALVCSALAGAGLAAATSPRVTYFLTAPFVLASIPALLAFKEPLLHRVEDPEPIRAQVATTYRILLERGRLRPVIATMVMTALLLQALLEFGPLWMLALAAPTLLFGAHWAGLMSALGLGGLLSGRTSLTRPRTVRVVVAVMLGCSLVMATSHQVVVVVAAQVGLALLLVIVGAFLSRLFHDQIPSTIRAGVSSGVGTLTWAAFLPFALAFGFVTRHSGVHTAAWMMVAITAMASVSLVHLATSRRVGASIPDRCIALPCGAPSTLVPALVDA
jgi:predicted MFS family arabinose efflux permease